MPKVKFTALVSDMKGKANGSVFASNSGGTYFRTNKTGGGRKSLPWASNKSGFADLSGQWKSLTSEQKQAWKDARTLYPTKNAFGEPRIPTAYELYMRLNGTLLPTGLDILSTPATPRSMPFVDDLDIIIPDQTVFAPKIITRMRGTQEQPTRMFMKTYLESINLSVNQTFSFRLITPSNFNEYWVIGKVFQLGSLLSPTSNGLNIFLRIDSATSATIYFAMQFNEDAEGTCTYFHAYSVSQAEILQQIHIVVSANNLTPDANEYFINGSRCTLAGSGWAIGNSNDASDLLILFNSATQNTYTGVTQGALQYSLYLGSISNTYYVPFSVSDFRSYGDADLIETCSNNNPCDEGYQCIAGQCAVVNNNISPSYQVGAAKACTDCVGNDYECIDGVCVYVGDRRAISLPVYAAKLYHGYILGGELIAISFTYLEGSKFLNEASTFGDSSFKMTTTQAGDPCDDCVGNDFECQDGVCVYVGDHSRIAPDNTLTYGPLAVFSNFGIEGEGYKVQLYYSKLISAGRSIEQVPYVLLGTFSPNGLSVNLSRLLLQITGNFSNEATYAFKAVLLDGTTGVVYDTQLTIRKPLKNVSKFKAGAELSGKVN